MNRWWMWLGNEGLNVSDRRKGMRGVGGSAGHVGVGCGHATSTGGSFRTRTCERGQLHAVNGEAEAEEEL